MNFPQHSKAGLIASSVAFVAGLIYFKEVDRPLLIGLAVYIGSIFPDLDTDSIPSRWAARIGLCFTVICFLKNPNLNAEIFNHRSAAIAGGLFFLLKSGKHRGIIHKYSFIAACLAAGYFFHPLFYAFSVGLIVHFCLDKISPLEKTNLV